MVGVSMSHLKYIIFSMIFQTGLFLFVYWLCIDSMPQDLNKLFWIFVDSFLTGWGGSLIARWASGYHVFKLNFRFWFGNFLVSGFYAIIVWLGLLGIMLSGSFDFVRFILIAASVKLLITYAAFSNSTKVADQMKKAIG